MISITAFGRIPSGQMVRRGGAKPGDRVLVTRHDRRCRARPRYSVGRRGRRLRSPTTRHAMLVGRYRVPQPRSALAKAVRDHAMRRWMSPTVLRAISPSCARHPASRRASMPSIPLSARRAALAGARRHRIEAIVRRRRRLRDPVRDPGRTFRGVCAGRRGSPGAAVTPIGTMIAGPPARFFDAAGREIALAAAVLQPFLGFRPKPRKARVSMQIPAEIDRLRLGSVAPGMRFWHGPADLRPPFWAGQAFFLCARRVPR